MGVNSIRTKEIFYEVCLRLMFCNKNLQHGGLQVRSNG